MGDRHEVFIEDNGARFACGETESVLNGMSRMGCGGIPSGCRGGGCGVCKVQITSGDYQCKPMSRSHISEQEQTQGIVLACRVMPLSDLSLKVLAPKLKERCDAALRPAPKGLAALAKQAADNKSVAPAK